MLRTIDTSRRRFLRGVGGVTLALPFLPSLAERPALGDPVYVHPKRFFCLAQNHGGILAQNAYPAADTLTESMTLYPGHDVRRGKLVRKLDGPFAQLSPMLRASANDLTDSMVAKMNVLRGLDVPMYVGHGEGHPLGNYGRNLGTPGRQVPTIDQTLAWSTAFYGNLQGSSVRQRIVGFGEIRSLSSGWSSPSTRTGGIQPLAPAFDLGSLYRALFGDKPAAASTTKTPRPTLLVDKVLADYKRLRSSSTRMSPGDRQRLDDHMDRLAQVQRQADAALKASQACQSPPYGPYGYEPIEDHADRQQVAMNMIATAFVCDTTRIAVGWLTPTMGYAGYSGDWHQNVAHTAAINPDSQAKMTEQARTWLFGATLKLARALDAVEESPGVTMLDNSLLLMTAESGVVSHDATGIPVVTFGSAGRSLSTGWHCDYRNVRPASQRSLEYGVKEYTGLYHAQWLATLGRAMGLAPADWQYDGKPGYGVVVVNGGYDKNYVAGVATHASDVLPWLAGPAMPA